ncbi:DUF7286 family protein [Haloplanus halobius]|uniref:DUF7286 family protein n=1 Tax=Haloplanus halobius TaxID=2934938 RepID=UPI00200D6ECC|nr:hypothetical protein [Haloplanus sp. XH21]
MTRLADDRRARVPFALLGVLLLVGASTFAAAVVTRGPDRIDRDVDVATERVAAGTTTAVRSAVGQAARDAAAEPVTTPADTPYGRLLSDEQPFRDALRLRIYLTLREQLSTTRYRRGDVAAVASLPGGSSPADLRRGMDRIDIRGVENGTAIRVTVNNVTVTARDGGTAVARERHTPTVTVSTPVLTLHDRTAQFETRLNRRPLDGPGLGRHLTGRLYPIAWARGYAQYRGLPLTNVVTNRHVETSTNGAVLAVQRSTFGRSDPTGRRSTRRALLELGVRDVTASTGLNDEWADRVLTRPNPSANVSTEIPSHRPSSPSPSRRIDIDAESASRNAATGLRTDTMASNRSLAGVFRDAYRVDAELRTRRRQTYDEPRPEPNAPGEEWTLAETRVSTDADVQSSTASTPTVDGEERRFDAFARHVTLDRRIRWTWRRGNDTMTTAGAWTERYRVGVTLVGEYAPNGTAPERPTRPRFERGGPLDGPNLADVPAKAETRLIGQQGGRDAVAVAVAADRLDVRERVVHGDRPAALRSWVNADLTALHDRLSKVSVGVHAGRIATYTVNPSERLADELRDRRTALIDPPEQYAGAADRARVAARAALVDATIRRLDRRAATHEESRQAFADVLGRAGIESPRALRRTLEQRHVSTPPSNESVSGAPPGGPVTLVPEGSPAYLTVASVGHDRASGVPPARPYHPLSARNVNLFAAPYGDAADAVAEPGFDRPSRARLRTAARTLLAASAVANGTDRGSRAALQESVAASMGSIRDRSRRVVRSQTRLSPAETRAAVAAGFDQWNGSARRAMAASNGSLAAAIATAAAARASTPSPHRAARLETSLETATDRTLRTPAGTVAERRVTDAATRVRDRALETATRRADTGRLNETVSALPAGLPVAPVPGYWYATVNVWTVSVRGAYARFALRTRQGAPSPSTAIRYVRDGSTVRLDVDGDGDAERLGRDDRVSFRTRTAIAVAVPPNRGGVGDVDGNADERAGTWPHPDCTSWVAADCPAAE